MATQAPSLQPQEQDTYKIVNVVRWILNQIAGTGTSGGGGATPSDAINSGILVYSSATLLTFKPSNGDLIKINGAIYAIPSAGIVGLANTGVFVGGVAAQNLAATTLYYVYAFINGGVITADFSTTTHATSTTAGNVGVEIKSGDDTRTLIGMVFTNGSNQFDASTTKRNVRTWPNQDTELSAGFAAAFTAQRSTANTNAAGVEINTEIRCEFCNWAHECAIAGGNGYTFNSGANYTFGAFGWDGVVTSANSWSANFGSQGGTLGLTERKSGLSEGHHYVTLLGYVAGGTGFYGLAAAPFESISGTLVP